MNWSIVATILVGFHLTAEFVHYILEFVWGKRDKNLLADIVRHRKGSHKTELLVQILEEVQELRHIKNNDYPYITYEALTGRKGIECCTCDFFHEGNGVDHSHCDSHKDGSLKKFVLQYDGKLPACVFWKARQEKLAKELEEGYKARAELYSNAIHGSEPSEEEIKKYMEEHDENWYNAREHLREKAYGGKPPHGFSSWGDYWKSY